MPAWEEYKQMAQSRGALAFELYVVVSTPIDPPRLPEVLPAHLEYQKTMEAAGTLFLAGPTSDESGEQMQGRGMIIYRASSMEEANDIAKQDPMHMEGVREYSIRKWLINEGAPTLSLSLSSKSVKLS